MPNENNVEYDRDVLKTGKLLFGIEIFSKLKSRRPIFSWSQKDGEGMN